MKKYAKLSGWLLSLILCSFGNIGNDKKIYKSNNFIGSSEKEEIFKRKQKEDNYSLLVLRDDYIKNNFITIYNEDNSIWKSFKFDDLFSDKEFEPYAINPENNLLVFKVVNKENDFYEIIVNETTNNKKYIKISNPNFRYLTLSDFVLTVAFVDINPKTNSLYQKPNEKSKQLIYNKNEFYRPIKISNNWLMIEDSDNQIYWVKWIDEKGELIIDLLFDA